MAKWLMDDPISSQEPVVFTWRKKNKQMATEIGSRVDISGNMRVISILSICSRSLITSVNRMRAKGGNRCVEHMFAKAAESRTKGTMILYISSDDIIAGWNTGTRR